MYLSLLKMVKWTTAPQAVRYLRPNPGTKPCRTLALNNISAHRIAYGSVSCR